MSQYGPTVLRLFLGVTFVMHAYLALFVFTPTGTAAYNAEKGIPLPAVAAWFLILAHGLGGIMMIVGLWTRWAALAIEAAERNGGQWQSAVREAGVDGDFYIFRDRSGDRWLPWHIIDGGMKDAFFRGELEKSNRAEWTLPPKRARENARLLPVLS